MRKDIYTIEFDFSDEIKNFDKALLKQVIYRDDRLYQSLILEWKYYGFPDVREFIKSIKKNKGIMDMLSTVQPFASYGLASNKLAITFKKDLKLSRKRALAIINNLVINCRNH